MTSSLLRGLLRLATSFTRSFAANSGLLCVGMAPGRCLGKVKGCSVLRVGRLEVETRELASSASPRCAYAAIPVPFVLAVCANCEDPASHEPVRSMPWPGNGFMLPCDGTRPSFSRLYKVERRDRFTGVDTAKKLTSDPPWVLRDAAEILLRAVNPLDAGVLPGITSRRLCARE